MLDAFRDYCSDITAAELNDLLSYHRIRLDQGFPMIAEVIHCERHIEIVEEAIRVRKVLN